MPISLVCPQCGIIAKSGKLSCCGRGGSWFGNCGVAGEAKLGHEWSEGFQACKAQSQSETVVGQQLHDTQHESNTMSNDIDTKNFTASANMVTSALDNLSTDSSTTTSLSMPTITVASVFMSHTSTDVAPVHTSEHTSMTAQGCRQVQSVIVQIGSRIPKHFGICCLVSNLIISLTGIQI